MLDVGWSLLSLAALVAGTLVILAPTLIIDANKRLNRVLVSVDELVLRYRHLVGVTLLIVAYLCFNLALLTKNP
jgi:hypothetical protein